MPSLIKKILAFLHRSQFVSSTTAAAIIRKFALGTPDDPGDWDDLETVNHSNPDVALAVEICWHFAATFPPQKPTEYCGKEAMPYFVAVADALEKGLLHSLDHERVIQSLKQNQVPVEVMRLLHV